MVTWLESQTERRFWASKEKLSDKTNRKWKKVNLTCFWNMKNSTIQTIWKNSTKVISAFEPKGSRIMRFLKPERSEVDEALLNWFMQARSDNALVSCSLLMRTSVLTKF